jgi:adenylate kinase
VLLIGRHDYWPGYTPEVIKSLDFDMWPMLALAVDSILEQRENERREVEAARSRAGRGR